MKSIRESLSGFARSEDGNFAVLMALCAVPLVVSAGFAVDYSVATNNRASMQNALDAATLAILTLPKDLTDTEREQKLQAFYTAGGGLGTVDLKTYVIGETGAASTSATASYNAPTNLMKLAQITQVELNVAAAADKPPTLSEAKFEIQNASGHWNKTMSLFGRKYGAATGSKDEKLMEIGYTFNNYDYDGKKDPKGYGTTTVYTVKKDPNNPTKEIKTKVQEQVCTTVRVKNWTGTAGVITGTSGSVKFETSCVVNNIVQAGAKIDVHEMNTLYLQMDVPSGNPKVLKSNDPNTSNRLYMDGIEVANGKEVDIFTAVPCGKTSSQAWEDGGNAVPAPVSNADFFYKVTGKCDYTQRPYGSRLTQ
jgi:Flp pilus assembly protein TadG